MTTEALLLLVPKCVFFVDQKMSCLQKLSAVVDPSAALQRFSDFGLHKIALLKVLLDQRQPLSFDLDAYSKRNRSTLCCLLWAVTFI